MEQQENLNQLLEQFRSGKLTQKQVLDRIICFVAKNYPLYGLHKYDEDFRQDILLNLLEKGSDLLNLFNPQFGDFFTFLYCYVSTMINSKLKVLAMHAMRERLTVEESINTLSEKQVQYHRIDFTNFDLPKAPFTRRKLDPEELKKAFKELSLKQKDKKIIILALKSSYYLTDEQIERLSSIYKINTDHLYDMIQYCKDSIEAKKAKWEKAKERRNFAYFHHKRYNRLLETIDETDLMDKRFVLKDQYIHKEKKHLHNMNRINSEFARGYLILRPTNKTLSNVIDVGERQINYYLRSARKEIEKRKFNKPDEDNSFD